MRRFIAFFEGWVVYIVLPALALLVTADVILRYVLNLPLQWGNDVKELLLLLVVVAGLPGVSHDDQHIRVGLLDNVLPRRVYRAWSTVRHILTALVAAVIAYAVTDLAFDMARYGDGAEMIAIPFWPFAAFVAAAAALSAVAELLRAITPHKKPATDFSAKDG
ncbi:MAG TPA: TRAP transporter small permease [Rhizobiaceae bacterium]|nr:TRAP transporter small permease [Rhizobiaceae bacterium]